MAEQTAAERLAWIRKQPYVKAWRRGLPYPDFELPEGYAYSYNVRSGRIAFISESSKGVPHLDPRFETYHCM